MGEYGRSEYTQYDNFNDKLNWKTITRDLLIFVAVIVIFMSLTPRQKEAPPVNEDAKTLQYLDEGSSQFTELMLNSAVTSDSSSGTKQYVLFDTLSSELGTTRWECDVTGTFAEQNGEYVCIYSNADFISYNTTFYKKDLQVTVEGDTIHCELTVGKRFFYIPTSEYTFELSLTCNPDGTLS